MHGRARRAKTMIIRLRPNLSERVPAIRPPTIAAMLYEIAMTLTVAGAKCCWTVRNVG
jgi:hypothetical protein